MNRLFGSTAPKAPKATLTSAVNGLDERISAVRVKIAEVDAELATYSTKMNRMREGPGKTAIRKKALAVFQKKKRYEQQQQQLESQVWNLENFQTMEDNVKNTLVTVDALKTANKSMKKELNKISIDKIERLQDEMADFLDIGNEIQDTLARSYDIPEEVDEADLDAELEALGAEMEMEMEMGGGESIPSFMQDEVPDFIDEAPSTTGKVKEAVG